MKVTKKNLLSLFFMALGSLISHGEQVLPIERVDSAEIHFRQSRTELLLDFEDNREQLNQIKDALDRLSAPDSTLYIKEIKVVGSASPEGSIRFNRWLSVERAKRIAEYLFPGEGLDNSLIHSEFTGRNWGG